MKWTCAAQAEERVSECEHGGAGGDIINELEADKTLSWQQRAVFVMALVGVTELLYFLMCILSFSARTPVQVVILLQLHMPYVLFFITAFHTWLTLAHSFRDDIEGLAAQSKKWLAALNAAIAVLLLVCNVDHAIFHVASFSWSALTTAMVQATVYAIWSHKCESARDLEESQRGGAGPQL